MGIVEAGDRRRGWIVGMQLVVMRPLDMAETQHPEHPESWKHPHGPLQRIKERRCSSTREEGRGINGEKGGRHTAGRVVSLHSSFICRFIKSRANFDIISFKQLHLAGVWNLFEIKKTITERQQSSKTTSET